MEGIEAESLAMITYQGKQCADERKLKDFSNIKNQNHFYATRRIRGGVGKRPRCHLRDMAVKASDIAEVRACFNVERFVPDLWLGSLSPAGLVEYATGIASVFHVERLINRTLDSVAEYVRLKVLHNKLLCLFEYLVGLFLIELCH